ncbi:MAG: MFS transporter [Pseudorhodoplanes sp.]|nr:MAG: MFS transporter [Pseudorhodoplanes sp.]
MTDETANRAGDAATTQAERRTFAVAAGAHALHDGYTDVLYVMLPVWQAEFGLSYAAVGALRAMFTGAMAGLQIPAGQLADRVGSATVLALGTALSGLGFGIAGASTGFAVLVVALLVGGIGSSTQHPVASALVARAYAGPRSLKAIGGYNFAGDVGKMLVPALAAAMMVVVPWRPTVVILGAAGLVAALAIALFTPRAFGGKPPAQAQATERTERATFAGAFTLLLGIGIIDSAVRMAFLTFMPFLLTGKGAGLPAIGIALTLVFAGGAAGKLACAYLGARIGVIGTVFLTEILTAFLIAAMLALPLEAAFVALPLLGIALNGTSSVLYGSVPDLVPAHRRTRAFGIFYTGTIGGGTVAPVIFGLAGDVLGLTLTLILIAGAALTTLPLAYLLRPAFVAKRRP